MGRKLRIVITVDPEIPVPPKYYGGIERIVDMLINGLSEKGHEVFLFAHPDSKTPAGLMTYPGKSSRSLKDTLANALAVARFTRTGQPIDVVHSFSRLAYLLFIMSSGIPKIQSYQRRIASGSIRLGRLLAGRSITFTSCSRYGMNTAGPVGGRWAVIPNGVPMSIYSFVPHVAKDAPIVYLGRVERFKGVHVAIEVARAAGRPLIIAGNHAMSREGLDYFKKTILPQCDGDRIKYIGPVDDAGKNKLLGEAAALLFPVEEGEPFGIVMAEALMCGTPVIGFNRGAVEEIVNNGVTGYVCDTFADMVSAVKNIGGIDRGKCRQSAEERFSDRAIVDGFERLYFSVAGKPENRQKQT
ncbi:MAG: glycosyltransferase family 4 protein [Candidatus Omnitrophota bacterium]